MTGSMRVLFIDETQPIAGGANSLLLLLNGMNRERYEPMLVAPEGPLAEAARGLGVTTLQHEFRQLRLTGRLLGRKMINPVGLWFRLWDAIRFARMARECGASIIHTNTLNAHIAGVLAGKLNGIPVIWHVRRMYSFSSILFRQRWLPDRIIFVSKAAKDAAFRGKPCERATVIHNGVDLKSFVSDPDAYADVRREFGIGATERIVGSVGRLDKGKGYEYFLDAAHRILSTHTNVRFVIVGEGQYGDEYCDGIRRQIEALGIRDGVILTGFRSDVARLASAFDVFVSPSVRDAHPRVVLEAMALGLPIVGTKSGGIVETVEDGKSGVLTPVEDASSLTDAIVQFLNDPQRAGQMGRNARQRVVERFSADAYVAEVQETYASLARKHRM